MNLRERNIDPRFEELLAGHALGDLDPSELSELRELARVHGMDLDALEFTPFEKAAADLAATEISRGSMALPQGLRDRLLRAADEFIAEKGAEASRGGSTYRFPAAAKAGSGGVAAVLAWTGWLAAAAAVVIAVVLTRSSISPGGAGRQQTIQETLASAKDAVTAPWGDWDHPEVAGVKGEVVWSASLQKGYMRFKGLPANDPTHEQYQLWIVDERGLADATGQSARISGGVFNASGGEVVVPIDPALKVGKAQLFALTIEKPGGVWVSDMKRRVVVAAIQ